MKTSSKMSLQWIGDMKDFAYIDEKMYYRIIMENLHRIPIQEFDVIVAVPRSGLILANAISQVFHKPLLTLNEFVGGTEMVYKSVRGSMMRSQNGRVLLVEDCIFSGKSLGRVYRILQDRGFFDKFEIHAIALFCNSSLYVNAVKGLDFKSMTVLKPLPDVLKLYYYNLFQNFGIYNRCCWDIDGLICCDPQPKDVANEGNYVSFLENAKPFIIPGYNVKYIVTARIEKYRKITADWLARHSVAYGTLIMCPCQSNEERDRKNMFASWKAEVYAKLDDALLFYESDERGAEKIFTLSGKACLARNGTMFKKRDLERSLGLSV